MSIPTERYLPDLIVNVPASDVALPDGCRLPHPAPLDLYYSGVRCDVVPHLVRCLFERVGYLFIHMTTLAVAVA